MGAAIFEQDALAYRPAYFDRTAVYPAEDGQGLYQVYKREKGAGYYVFRWACKLARVVQRVEWWWNSTPEEERFEVTNPNGVERQGLWDSEEKAQAECFWLKRVSKGRAAVGYEKVLVNRTTGYERRHMKGLTDPTKWVAKGTLSTVRARYAFVDMEVLRDIQSDLTDLRRLAQPRL